MKLKAVVDEDFVNYKKPSMFLIFPYCNNFKCEKECGKEVCQNKKLTHEPIIDIDIKLLIARYHMNEITSSVICGGLEPFDSLKDLMDFIKEFRRTSNDDIVIYTGYTEEELKKVVRPLTKNYKNIIIKFGRYIPDQKPHYDNILEVYLASDNQYAKAYNYCGEKE